MNAGLLVRKRIDVDDHLDHRRRGSFLLGMTVMTAGLKGLAGSGLRTALSKAAETPLRGAFWGGVATLLVQSSSATTMTTIGLVSAGLLTFPQGLGLVFGANVGTR